jgi:hypothetical protein
MYVSKNKCEACLAGTTRLAGDDPLGPDTKCNDVICGENQKVLNNLCVDCEPGKISNAGSKASGENTECIIDYCPENHYVLDHQCVQCPEGSISEKAPKTVDTNETHCKNTNCLVNEYVSEGSCKPCPTGTTSKGGKSIGHNTSCDYRAMILTNEITEGEKSIILFDDGNTGKLPDGEYTNFRGTLIFDPTKVPDAVLTIGIKNKNTQEIKSSWSVNIKNVFRLNNALSFNNHVLKGIKIESENDILYINISKENKQSSGGYKILAGFINLDNSNIGNCQNGYYYNYKNNECIICPTGFFCQSQNSFYCQTGYYQDEIGKESCKPVEPGYYKNVEEYVPLKCPTGYYCQNASMIRCSTGSYQDEIGQGICKSAEAGNYINDERNAVSQCLSGHYCQNGFLIPCSIGSSYQDETGKGTCKTGGVGYYINAERNKALICPTGYYCQNGNRIQCSPGYYQDKTGQTSCAAAKAGYYINTERDSSIICPSGHYCENGNKIQCDSGSYQNLEGQTYCKQCNPGSYQDLKGQSSCKICLPGSYASGYGWKTPCMSCSPGQYQSNSGADKCLECPDGYYCPSNIMANPIKCPYGEYDSSSPTKITYNNQNRGFQTTTSKSSTSQSQCKLPDDATCGTTDYYIFWGVEYPTTNTGYSSICDSNCCSYTTNSYSGGKTCQRRKYCSYFDGFSTKYYECGSKSSASSNKCWTGQDGSYGETIYLY